MDTRLIQTLVITDSFLSAAPYIFLKIKLLYRTLCNTDTVSGPKGVRNNAV